MQIGRKGYKLGEDEVDRYVSFCSRIKAETG